MQPPDNEPFNPFPAAQRGIFGPVFNGAAMVYYDPLRVRRRLQALLGSQAGELIASWEHLPAQEQFLGAVREAFDLPPFDPATGAGATEETVLGLWAGWQAWVKKNGPSTPNSPTTSRPTATPQATPPTTPPTSASPSAPPAWTPGVPGPLRGPAS